ncbi:MAG: chemotaxis protein CheD [Eubacteriales bacterium]
MSKKYVYLLFVGDYLITQEKDIMLSTVLGSCVAVCLADKATGIVGMNHFMLPGWSGSNDATYCLDATSRLITEMVNQGAPADRLRAKVFGGATMFRIGKRNVAESNISSIFSFLSQHQIPVEAADTGEGCARRIYFCSNTYTVHVRSFGKALHPAQCDSEYVTFG